MVEESAWDDLPDLLARVARCVPLAARRITTTSQPRWVSPGGLGEINYLRSVKLTQRLYVVKVQKKTFFFIFHLDPTRRVLIDAKVDLGILPVSDPPPAAVASTADSWEVQYPSLLLRGLADGDGRQYGPEGATPENTLFLGLGAGGKDILAVNLDADPPRLRYSPGGVPGATEPRAGEYPLRPVLELIETLTTYQQQASTPGQLVVLPRTSTGTIPHLLDVALKGCAAAEAALPPDNPTVPDWYQDHFVLSSYNASLDMCLTAAGDLAKKSDEEQFRVNASVSVNRLGQPMGRVVMSLPDLVVPDDQRAAFSSALMDPGALRFLAPTIGGVLGILPEAVRGFLDSASQRSRFVRCSRDGGQAEYLIALKGNVDRAETDLLLALVFRGREKPEVDSDSDAEVSSIEGLGEPRIQLKAATAQNFLDLLRTLRSWALLLT